MPKQKPPKVTKTSELAEDKVVDIPTLDYTDQEQTYIKNLQRRLSKAKTARDQEHAEFDGMTYLEYWWSNERGMNTLTKAKKNKGDPSFQSGTLRTKALALLSTVVGLNLNPDISAFNEQEVIINTLGNAMEDIIDKCGELEGDEEKRMLREYELLKQGTVFVEDIWDERWETEKQVTGFYGQKTGVKWTSKRVKAMGRPVRTIIPGPAVYLGDLRQYFIENQPFIFSVEIKGWEEAKAIYGGWDMWKYVTKDKKGFTGAADQRMLNNAFRLMAESVKGKVEVIKYQDKPNNEFQIIINGIPMLPIGYPLTEVSPDGEYTIVQQNREPIRENFAYGPSFVFQNKNAVAVLDRMLQLAVLKTHKSYMPPRLNLSERVVSKRMFMPGQITTGVEPGQIPPVDEKEARGVTSSEFGMIQEVVKWIDRNTVSQTVTGAKEEGGKVTATQIIQLQRQARIMMALLMLSAGQLEKKLAVRRLMILLDKWFDPIDKTFNKARDMLKNKYRFVSRQRMIEGEGMGLRMVMPTEEMPESPRIREMEETMGEKLGMPVRMIMLNSKQLKKAKYTWVVTVNPKEKRSSEYSKLLFDEMIARAMNLGLNINPDWVEERFAQVWEEDPTKMFRKGEAQVPPPEMPEAPKRRKMPAEGRPVPAERAVA